MDGRGLSIWDVFANTPGQILDGSNPSIADDFYHTYKEDIRRMKEIGIQSFRFSLPGRVYFRREKGAINQKGLDFYKRLVEELLKNDIVPNATLYHWDLPYELERLGGWLEPRLCTVVR